MQLGEYNEKKSCNLSVGCFICDVPCIQQDYNSGDNSGWIGYRGYYGVEAPTEPKVGE